MPLNTTTLPDFMTGTIVQASDIRNRLDTIQQFLNGQIGSSELSGTSWVDHTHVISPEFYGAPSRRTVSTSFHAWHRRSIPEGSSTDFVVRHEDFANPAFGSESDSDFSAIRDAAATIHVPPIDTGGTVGMAIWCNWYTYNSEGTLSAATDLESNLTDHIAAAFRIFVDDTGYTESTRYLHATTSWGDEAAERIHRKDMSTCVWIPSISGGPHSVALKMLVFKTPAGVRDWKHVWVGPRFFEVEIFLL